MPEIVSKLLRAAVVAVLFDWKLSRRPSRIEVCLIRTLIEYGKMMAPVRWSSGQTAFDRFAEIEVSRAETWMSDRISPKSCESTEEDEGPTRSEKMCQPRICRVARGLCDCLRCIGTWVFSTILLAGLMVC